MDSFDSFCLFLGKATLFLAIFLVIVFCGTMLLGWVMNRIFGKDKMEENERLMQRMVLLLESQQKLEKNTGGTNEQQGADK